MNEKRKAKKRNENKMKRNENKKKKRKEKKRNKKKRKERKQNKKHTLKLENDFLSNILYSASAKLKSVVSLWDKNTT